MTNKTGLKQVAIRLTPKQWQEIKHYIADNETSFQALVIKLLSENVLRNDA